MEQVSRELLGDETAEYDERGYERSQAANCLFPINQLPPEILSEVFLTWVATWRAKHRCERPGPRSHRWVIIAQVCHLWREVALDTPRLWNDIVITGHKPTEAMLQRSMQAPMHIKIWMRSPHDPVQHALNHLSRIETLEFFAVASKTLPHAFLVGNTAPLLRRMMYRTVKPWNSRRDIPNRYETTVFDSVDMPRLSHLELLDSRLPWSSPLLKPTLTHLEFKAWQVQTDYKDIEILDVLRALGSMPMLEHLELHQVLPAVKIGSHLPRTALPSFPHLRSMSIYAPTRSIAYLLECVECTTTANIRIDCSDYDPQGLQSLLLMVAEKLSTQAAGGAPRISSIDSRERAFRVWIDDPGVSALLPWPSLSDIPRTSPPLLSLTVPPTNPCRCALLPQLGTVVPMQDVTTLYFDPFGRRPKLSYWIEAFKVMPKLRTVGVTRRGYPFLDIALNPCRDGEGSSHGTQHPPVVLLPDLKALVLQGLWMRPRPNADTSAGVLPSLSRMLASRTAAGYPLHTLWLLRCVNIKPEDVDALEVLAREIRWDGKERWLDEASYFRYRAPEDVVSTVTVESETNESDSSGGASGDSDWEYESD